MNIDEVRVGDILLYSPVDFDPKGSHLLVVKARSKVAILNCFHVHKYAVTMNKWFSDSDDSRILIGAATLERSEYIGNLLDNPWVGIQDWIDFLEERAG